VGQGSVVVGGCGRDAPHGFTDIVHVQRLKPFAPREDAVNIADFYEPSSPDSDNVPSGHSE
jgi:hypothetical protein